MTTLQSEAASIFASPLGAVISDGSTLNSLKKLKLEKVCDLANYFPKRYINLDSCTPIGHTVLNEKNVVCGEVHEVSQRDVDDRVVFDVTLKDKTGVLLFTICDKRQLTEVHSGTFLIASGEVYFDYGFKRMKRQLLVNASSLVKSRILPVYETRFACDQLTIRESVRQVLYRLEHLPDTVQNQQMSLAQAYRSIHFANDIDTLKAAIRRLKIEQLSSVDLSPVQKILSGEFPEAHDLSEECSFDLEIFNMADIGDALSLPRATLEKEKRVYILSPLAGLNSIKRDDMTYFGTNCEIETATYYPKVCIESAGECRSYAGQIELLKRKNYYQGILNAPDGSVFVTDNLCNIKHFGSSDCLIIEDADRCSLIALYGCLKRAKCKAVLLTRSRRPEALKRLETLQYVQTYSDVLNAEIECRYPGDILGNREPTLKSLKLINLYKDRPLIESMHKH